MFLGCLSFTEFPLNIQGTGLLIFAVKSAVPDPDVTLKEIFIGSIPYWIMIIVVALTVISFPSIASWLPAQALG